MIVDAHTHIYPDCVAKKAINTIIGNTGGRLKACADGTFAGLMSSMDAAGVDLSVVLPVATQPSQSKGILQWIKDLIPSSPRLIFFGSVHPYDPDFRDCVREIAACGLQGLKFHPAYQDFPVNSKEAYDVYEEALKRDLTLYFHAGFDLSLPKSEYASVDRFSALLKDFSGSKIVLAHGGGYGEWGRVMDFMGGGKCYFDVAFVLESMKLNNDARELYRQNEDYFLFGSDTPWRDQSKYVALIRNSDTLTEEQKEKLFYKNVSKLIKLPQSGCSVPPR